SGAGTLAIHTLARTACELGGFPADGRNVRRSALVQVLGPPVSDRVLYQRITFGFPLASVPDRAPRSSASRLRVCRDACLLSVDVGRLSFHTGALIADVRSAPHSGCRSEGPPDRPTRMEIRVDHSIAVDGVDAGNSRPVAAQPAGP